MGTPPGRDAAAQARAAATLFRRQLAEEARTIARRLAAAYARVLRATAQPLREFQAVAEQREMTTAELAGHGALIRLRDAYAEALADISGDLLNGARLAQASGVRGGALAAGATLDGVVARFNVPSLEALAALVGYVDSRPFRDSLARFGPYHAQRIRDLVLVGANVGRGPLYTARLVTNYIRGQMGAAAALADMVRMTRTVQVYSARSATMAVYRANPDVVRGWVWVASLDDRVCMSCVAMHGTRHGLDETLNDHHAGRCAAAPITPTWRDLGFSDGGEVAIETGAAWFAGLPEDEQRRRMGDAAWRAWRDGAFDLGALSVPYGDPVYGTMRRAATLKELVGDEAAAAYRRAA